MIQSMLTSPIIRTVRCISEKAVANYEVPTNAGHTVRIMVFMLQNYRNDITREDAAHALFLSARHIDRVLKEQHGLTFQQLLQQRRLEAAKNLPAETHLSLNRIAEDVGFPSASYLSTLFKEKEGITASAFKRRIINNRVRPASSE